MKNHFSCVIMLTCASVLTALVACDDEDEPAAAPAADAGPDAVDSAPPVNDGEDASAPEASTVLPTIPAAEPGTCRFVVDGVTLTGTQVEGSGGFGTTAVRGESGVTIQCIATAGDVNHTLQVSATGPVAAGGSYTGVSGAPKADEVYMQVQYSPIKQGTASEFFRQTAGAKIGFKTLDARAIGTFDVAVTRSDATKVIQGAFDLTVTTD